MQQLNFSDLIDINSLQMMQDSFAEFTGLALCVIDSKGELVGRPSNYTDFCDNFTKRSEKGAARCDECDRNGVMRALREQKGIFYTCHAGLTDFVIPVAFEGNIIGGILAGKVRTDEIDEEKLRKDAQELGLDPDGYVEAAEKVKYITKERAEAVTKFLMDFARALAVMAHENYKKMIELRRTERISRSQSDFITGLTDNLRVSMRDWIDRFGIATERFMDIPEIQHETEELLFRAGEVYTQISGAIDYIHMAGGNVEYFESIYDVRSLIAKTAESLEKQAQAVGVKIGTRFDDSLPETLAGNSGRIGQIVNKLAVTLLNFTNPGGTVTICASCEKADYSHNLVITIEGTGTRMTEKAAAAISALIEGGGADVFGEMGNVTAKDADLGLIMLLLRQMSGCMRAVKLVNGSVIFEITIPQLDGSKKNA